MTSYLSRRALLKGMAGLGVGATLAGCSAPVLSGLGTGGDTAGSLDYWNLFGGGDGVRMTADARHASARPTRPSTSSAVTLAWGNPYYTKLSLATLGEKPPDVADLPPDPDEDPGRRGPARGAAAEDLARLRDDPGQVRPHGLGGRAGRRQGVRDPAGHPPVRDVLQHRHLREGRPARLRRASCKPLDSPEEFTDAHAKAKQVTGAVRRGRRGHQRHLDSVADVPVALHPARRQMLADEGTQGGDRRRQGDAGARPSCEPDARTGCSRPTPTTRARSPPSPPGRPASSSRASGRSPPSRPRRCRSP